MKYGELEEGMKLVSRSRIITPTDVDLFAAITGVTNPPFPTTTLDA